MEVAQIIVSCDRWLGFGARYVVRLDGQEVGRLGRRSKVVRTHVLSGSHTLVVDYNGRLTPSETVDLGQDEIAQFELQFGSLVAGAMLAAMKPWRDRVREPASASGEVSFMALERVDAANG